METQNNIAPTVRKDIEEQASRKLTPSELSDIQGGGWLDTLKKVADVSLPVAAQLIG